MMPCVQPQRLELSHVTAALSSAEPRSSVYGGSIHPLTPTVTRKEISAKQTPEHINFTKMQTSWPELRSALWNLYKYSPLDHSARSIRLLRVLPNGPGPDLLRCEMHHADVDSTYTCLSYVWGPPEPTHRIAINGKFLRVRQNLLDFLEQAARRYTKQLFWIDALCIDQDSVSERNHQVQQMGSIFQNAGEVIAWFGNEKGIARFFERPKGSGGKFHDFWSSEYWDRAWITQEVTLAKQLTLMAGNKTLHVDDLNIVYHHGHPAYDRFKILDPAALSTFKSMSLLRLLDVFKLKECERPRDKIFSLLALCGEGSDIKVDYSWSTQDVLKHVLFRCPRSLCWCSVKTLCHVLQVYDNSGFSRADKERPFAQFTVSISYEEGEPNPSPAYINVGLDLLCDRGRFMFLQITPRLDSRSVETRTRYIPPWRPERRYGSCTVKIADDRRSITIQLSLLALLEIARGINANGVCAKSTKRFLQLCGDTHNDFGFAAIIELMSTDPCSHNLMSGHVRVTWNES